MRKGHISLLLCDFAYITIFLCFQGEPSGFISKVSILGRLRRRVEVRGSAGHQEQGKARETGEARTGIKVHDCAPTHLARPAGQQYGTGWLCLVARPCHVCGAVGFIVSRFFFSGSFHSAFFPLLFLLF